MVNENKRSERTGRLGGRWGVSESVIGFAVAVTSMWLLVKWLTSGAYYDGHLALLLSYAVVWLPLLGACVFYSLVTGTRSFSRDLGLRFTWLDALFGIGLGLLARVIASLAEIAYYGRMNGLGVTFGEVVYDGWWVFGVLLAPILFAPFVEEIFFRGLVQRTTLRLTSRVLPAITATGVSVLVSALLFTLLHLAEVTNLTAAAVLGISTFVFGLGSGLLAALTGRTGGSIVAHLTFNGSLVLSVLLA
jgi:membrane protease YdiL (CAAX protease family)